MPVAGVVKCVRVPARRTGFQQPQGSALGQAEAEAGSSESGPDSTSSGKLDRTLVEKLRSTQSNSQGVPEHATLAVVRVANANSVKRVEVRLLFCNK